MNNTELIQILWDIESHINMVLASPHEGAGNTRLQEALEGVRELQDEWCGYQALYVDYCLRQAAKQGALSHEECAELTERLGAAMRAAPDPQEPVVHPKHDARPHKGFRVALLVAAAIAIILMVVAAMAMVFDIPFGTLIGTVAIVTVVAAVLLGVIWVVCGGDTGPELK